MYKRKLLVIKLWFYLFVFKRYNIRKVELTVLMHNCNNFLILFPITEAFALGLFREI